MSAEQGRSSHAARAIAAGLLVGSAGLLLVLTVILIYARFTLSDVGRFGSAVDRFLSDREVEDELATLVEQEAVHLVPNLKPYEADIKHISAGAVASETFRDTVTASLQELHRDLIGSRSPSVSLTIDLEPSIRDLAIEIDPELGAALPPDPILVELVVIPQSYVDDVRDAYDRLLPLILVAGGLTALLTIAAIVLSRRRARTVGAILGTAAAIALLFVLSDTTWGQNLITHQINDPIRATIARTAVEGFGDVMSSALLLVAIVAGVVCVTLIAASNARDRHGAAVPER